MKITLKAARINAGFTQDNAAKEIGVSSDTIRNWETGKTFPNIEQVKKILNLYNADIDDVIFLS